LIINLSWKNLGLLEFVYSVVVGFYVNNLNII
jgi:hypothetical protein